MLTVGNINNFKCLSGSLKMCLELTEILYRKLIESDLLQMSLMCIYRTAAQKGLPSLCNSLTQAVRGRLYIMECLFQ